MLKQAFITLTGAAALGIACTSAVNAASMTSTSVNLVQNGDFETGNLTGWSTSLVGGNRGWQINNGTVLPPTVGAPNSAVLPISGSFDAFNTQGSGGVGRLFQYIEIPDNIVSATLSWKDRLYSIAPLRDPFQEFRVSLAGMEVFSTNFGDVAIQPGPNARSFDVTSILQGVTTPGPIELDFTAEVRNFFFPMYLDDVRLDVVTQDVPEPVPTPALLPGLIGLGVAALRKKGQVEPVEQEA